MNAYPATKYARLFSDLHLNNDVPKKVKNFNFDMLWTPSELPTDKETVLILAGDLWEAGKPFSYFGKSWMAKVAARFQYVVVVLGNHDFWGGHVANEYAAYRKKIKEQQLDNVFLLQNSSVLIGNVKFMGGTLWTDFNKGDSYNMMLAKDGLPSGYFLDEHGQEVYKPGVSSMNDYKYIRYGAEKQYHHLYPHNVLAEHRKTREYLVNNAKKDYPEQKLWVVTHHLPTKKSINPKHDNPQSEQDNYWYYSDLDDFILHSEVNFWSHGHVHMLQDYMLGNTRILANPRGYPGENTLYTQESLFDLANM